MASNVVNVLVNMTVKGRDAIKGAGADLEQINKGVKGAQETWKKYTFALGAAAGTLAGVGLAAKVAWGALEKGTALEGTRVRFDKLSESIGTTSNALLNDLKAATDGTVTSMNLMATASQLVSLGLTRTHDQTVRLTSVAGQLGWNMEYLIMEMNNMTGLRLDALGLQLDAIKEKAAELREAGMSAKEAWAEAIIQAGEQKIELAGMTENEKAVKQATAAFTEMKDALLLSTTATLAQAGAFESMSASAATIVNVVALRTEINQLRDQGVITFAEWLSLIDQTSGKVNAAAVASEVASVRMRAALSDTDGALTGSGGAWAAWATGVSIANENAARSTAIAAASMIANLGAVQDAEKAASVGFMSDAADARYNTRLGRWARASQSRARMNDNRLYVRDLRGDEERAARNAASMGGYSSAVWQTVTAEEALAASHARLADAFMSEITAKPEEGLINAEGLVNVQAMTESLYDQARAAGAGAVELAMLGVATGKFTKEQAAAALKAAVLQEQIRKIAAGVADGSIKYDAAVQHLEEFRQKLDASGGGAEGATANVEELVGMAEELTQGPYAADINANTTQAQADLQATLDLIRGIEGVHQATVVVDTQGNQPTHEAMGGPVTAGRPYIVGEVGPELFVPGSSGYIVPNNQLSQFQSGGSTVTVQVTNYVNGQHVNRAQLDDITEDRLKHAMRAMGVV